MTLRILIAEGDAELRQVFQEYFAELGYAAEVASDSFACLGALRQFRPEALVIDADLPGGAESVLAEVGRVTSLKRVVVTGGETADQLAESVEAPAACSLLKPFRLHALLSTLAFVEPERSVASNGTGALAASVCAPLVGQDGSMLGVLQMASHDHHRRFSQADVDLLAGVVSQAALAIESAHQREEATKRRDLERQLEFASQVQMSFLPKERPRIAGYEFYDHYEAALGIGGDFFDYVPLPDGRWVVALGDVAGKGVPAALLMARLHSMARYHFLAEPAAGHVLTELNAGLATCGLGHRFVTFVAAVLDPRRHEVTIVNAGHIPPLRVRPTGEVELVGGEASGLPLGIRQDHQYKQFTLPLEPGDTLVFFTDGVTEAMSDDDEMYGMARLRRVVAEPQGSVHELGSGLIADVENFSGGRPQCDDICVVCLRRRPAG
ncbi:MAG TPA: SpoIIE family protein phosphatase [Planctomycetaceae bacterium]|nr:SpoIIE family protein phosphatase [Planctomycetaceae bacterium]